ncbi:MAG: HlyD family efflux transporter periplasmic adaptor subunit [Silicimonas sp.]|nr:HlyD family efflux transporter periplasmic adaptor subunit [Silicimonas sp.]
MTEAREPVVAGMIRPARDAAGDTASLLRILQLEADIRKIESARELVYHLANESRAVLGFRQAFVLRRRRGWHLEAVSSVPGFDRHAPLNRQVVQLARRLDRAGEDVPRVDLADENELPALRDHALRHGLWLPFRGGKGRAFAGVLLLQEKPWPDSFLPLAERMRDAYAYSWRALAGKRLERRSRVSGRVLALALGAAVVATGFLPMPLTVMAPVEVTGRDRLAVAAPLNGTIDAVMVAPNQPVREGTLLARFEDNELRNDVEVAEQRVIVASARLEQVQNAAFGDRTAARDLKVAEAELALAQSEAAQARERLSRVELRARRDGIAIFEDARDLTGRPVSLGERLMEIADPGALEFTITMPVDDSIVVNDGARVRVFLDSAPLEPLEAELIRSSYHATTQPDGSFGYTLVAGAETPPQETRIGARGTAQVFGARHTLFFIVFRRPLSWLRQSFGA